ncbi:ATP-binding cassette domain-containing protein [Candidatus Saccharibacteria bacterium]|nr:ATP-binding cassette domain-containing protein [Candidatus Saccharibacteria bacterium]
MLLHVQITEKSFGSKSLFSHINFSVNDGEKIGIIGRNGIGKTTIFNILSGKDTDFTGEIIQRRGTTAVATSQEYHDVKNLTTTQYILSGLPDYARLSGIINNFSEITTPTHKQLTEFSDALELFSNKDYYHIEDQVREELKSFQLESHADQLFSSLSGGQKRLSEVIKIMHSNAHIALVDEPTNFMDYVAKNQFIEWMKSAPEAILIITHDRDVLREVDRIIEIKDQTAINYKGNYEFYLRENTSRTSNAMTDYELVERRIENLKQKILDYQRLKEKARNPATIQQFKRLENTSRKELSELQKTEKPNFWIDRSSVEQLGYKDTDRYDKYKAKNVKLALKSTESKSKKLIAEATDLSVGYDSPLFKNINFQLREGEALEIRGRNGAGKTTLVRALLSLSDTDSKRKLLVSERLETSVTTDVAEMDEATPHDDARVPQNALSEANGLSSPLTIFHGESHLDPHVRLGIYHQEVDTRYFDLLLPDAIDCLHQDAGIIINDRRIRQLMSDYLFTDSDRDVLVKNLSGGQKARLQIIAMLANDPTLLILDEPTSHLDLPSIEELEQALLRYHGAVLYISHDNYFRHALPAQVLQIPDR